MATVQTVEGEVEAMVEIMAVALVTITLAPVQIGGKIKESHSHFRRNVLNKSPQSAETK